MIPSRFVFAVGFFCSYASFSSFQSFGLAIKRDDELFNREYHDRGKTQ